jgi:hypothetical protein
MHRLFTTVQIVATGIVNGCACRDADATLRLGDLHKQPLRDMISNRNQTYMKLIDEQRRDEVRKICETCDFTRAFTATARFTGRMGSRCSHWRNSRLLGVAESVQPTSSSRAKYLPPNLADAK